MLVVCLPWHYCLFVCIIRSNIQQFIQWQSSEKTGCGLVRTLACCRDCRDAIDTHVEVSAMPLLGAGCLPWRCHRYQQPGPLRHRGYHFHGQHQDTFSWHTFLQPGMLRLHAKSEPQQIQELSKRAGPGTGYDTSHVRCFGCRAEVPSITWLRARFWTLCGVHSPPKKKCLNFSNPNLARNLLSLPTSCWTKAPCRCCGSDRMTETVTRYWRLWVLFSSTVGGSVHTKRT